MADQALPGYPLPIGGSSNIIVATHQGPTLYVQGGEVITASTFGWGCFHRAGGSISFNKNNSGNYTGQVSYPVGQSPIVANNNIVGVVPTGSNNITLKWIAANGTEAANNTNLSGEFVRMEYIGG